MIAEAKEAEKDLGRQGRRRYGKENSRTGHSCMKCVMRKMEELQEGGEG